MLAEGNVYQNVPVIVEESSFAGQMFSNGGTSCTTSLGRACQTNIFGSSGAMSYATTSFLTNFEGANVCAAVAPTSALETTIPANAGNIL